MFGHFYSRKSLVNRVKRSGKQAGLLSGHNSDGVCLAKQFYIRKGTFTCSDLRIHLCQRFAKCVAVGFVGFQDFRDKGGKVAVRRYGVGIIPPERTRIAKIIKKQF